MDQDEFNDFVRRKPFRPYRMTLSDGRTYDLAIPTRRPSVSARWL